jgi:hypothetical protein
MAEERSRPSRRPRRSDPGGGGRGGGGRGGGEDEGGGRAAGLIGRRRRSRPPEPEPQPERQREREPQRQRRSRRGPSGRQPSGMQVALRARDAVAEMTGLDAESVSAIERTRDGTWRVTVEVLEVERVPDTDDVLGSYEAEVDDDGELLGYSRVSRYPRSRPTQAQGGRGF